MFILTFFMMFLSLLLDNTQATDSNFQNLKSEKQQMCLSSFEVLLNKEIERSFQKTEQKKIQNEKEKDLQNQIIDEELYKYNNNIKKLYSKIDLSEHITNLINKLTEKKEKIEKREKKIKLNTQKLTFLTNSRGKNLSDEMQFFLQLKEKNFQKGDFLPWQEYALKKTINKQIGKIKVKKNKIENLEVKFGEKQFYLIVKNNKLNQKKSELIANASNNEEDEKQKIKNINAMQHQINQIKDDVKNIKDNILKIKNKLNKVEKKRSFYINILNH
jgi:hypothetical protein